MQIAATADEEAGNSFNALNQERPEYKEGEERPKPQPQNPVKPMTAEEEVSMPCMLQCVNVLWQCTAMCAYALLECSLTINMALGTPHGAHAHVCLQGCGKGFSHVISLIPTRSHRIPYLYLQRAWTW